MFHYVKTVSSYKNSEIGSIITFVPFCPLYVEWYNCLPSGYFLILCAY